VQELLKTNQTKLLGVREKLADLHKHYKELEAQQNRDTTQVQNSLSRKLLALFPGPPFVFALSPLPPPYQAGKMSRLFF
jgi:hypothetical protein